MKTVVKSLIIIFILALDLFSSVKLNSSNTFVKGEPFIFEFEIAGSSIKFPKIEKIDSYVVQSLGTSRSLQIINGNYSEKISQKFQILPQEDFTIPSFTFEINGTKVQSPSRKITQRKVNKTVSNNFDLELKASKQKAYVGEDILLKLAFKYKKSLQITNLGFEPPHFENFWYKKIENKNRRYEDNGSIVQELEYLLFPQKEGKLKINPVSIIVQLVNQNSNYGNFSFLSVPSEKRVYSNSLDFDIKPLPKNTNLIGDFDINASIDKDEIKEGESVSLKLNIKGTGNFDDLEDYKLNIQNATIYDNKPQIKTSYSKNGYEGSYEKTFSIVPSSSITIPSFKLKYFDKKQNKIIEKTTKEFKLKVNSLKKDKVTPKLEKAIQSKETTKVIEKSTTIKEKLLYFSLGSLFTILIFGLYNYVKIYKQKTKEDKPLIKRIKSAKTKEEILKLLLPYLKYDSKLDELIFKCEKTEDFKETKKDIISLVKQLDIKG
ncbi:MAG: BatD family protein [Campylobacteraceae bacterium]|nr:BatD family protein [Campylobacteraceae bacterium]